MKDSIKVDGVTYKKGAEVVIIADGTLVKGIISNFRDKTVEIKFTAKNDAVRSYWDHKAKKWVYKKIREEGKDYLTYKLKDKLKIQVIIL